MADPFLGSPQTDTEKIIFGKLKSLFRHLGQKNSNHADNSSVANGKTPQQRCCGVKNFRRDA
jgi:hypothetical protein